MQILRILPLIVLIIGSCQSENKDISQEESNNNELKTIESDNNRVKMDFNELISTDSLYKIKIYKTAIKMNNGTYPMAADTFQYTCIEFSGVDSNFHIALPSYKTRSPAQPEFYLTITAQDSNHIAASNWQLCEHSTKSLKFYFALDAFEEFDASTYIWLGYPGWGYRSKDDIIKFNPNNFNTIISGLDLPNNSSKIANNKWFSNHGLNIGRTVKRNVHNI